MQSRPHSLAAHTCPVSPPASHLFNQMPPASAPLPHEVFSTNIFYFLFRQFLSPDSLPFLLASCSSIHHLRPSLNATLSTSPVLINPHSQNQSLLLENKHRALFFNLCIAIIRSFVTTVVICVHLCSLEPRFLLWSCCFTS